MDKAIVSYETKHPALLPHGHKISRLITQEAHQCGHPGVARSGKDTYWRVLKTDYKDCSDTAS